MRPIFTVDTAAHPSRRAWTLLIGSTLLVTAFLPACAPFDYSAHDAPVALRQAPRLTPAPQIAIVLGSGGPRGYAHIGVMRVLEEAGIEPALIVGSSVGALLGVFWGSGMTAAEIDALSEQGGPLTLFDVSLFADRGWIHGERLQRYVNDRIRPSLLQSLRRPVMVVATQRRTKEPAFFVQGNAGVAVRASSAMPGIISPVGILGVEYEDGDESLPLAVSAARAAGARFVIAVDVSARSGSTPDDAPRSFVLRDRARRQRIEPEVASADFLIHPDLPYYAGPMRSYFDASRRIGEETARARLPELMEALHRAGLRH